MSEASERRGPSTQRPGLSVTDLPVGPGRENWGDRWELLPTTPSTNRVAAQRAREGAAEGLVVVAQQQTAGRGRLDRRWESPPGAGLTFSVLLRPSLPDEQWPWIGLLAAVAVAETVGRVLGQEPIPSATAGSTPRVAVKWPNDVLVDGYKIAGLLNERVETPAGAALVVGIGLNVDQRAEELPIPQATSLRLAAGRSFTSAADRGEVLVELVDRLERCYRLAALPGERHAAYLAWCGTIGQQVRVELPTGPSLYGEAVGVDASGRLQVRTASGIEGVSAGDVVHVRRSR